MVDKMEAIQFKVSNIEMMLPQEIYHVHLHCINNISFTPREIDILACILSGRTAKKIASFLLIAPKTVENHIRNILLKLDLRTQAGIIDFIEKSGKYSLVKQYYLGLLVKDAFEKTLVKLSELKNNPKIVCFIVSDGEQNDNHKLFAYLENHLSVVGVKLQLNPDTVANIKSVDITEQKNYYFLVLEIIKIISKSNATEQLVLEFKRQYELYAEIPLEVKLLAAPKHICEKNETKSIGIFSDIVYLFKNGKRRKLLLGFCLSLAIFCICVLTNGLMSQRASIDSKPMASILAQLEAGKNASWNLPRQDHLFVGREKLLRELSLKLEPTTNKYTLGFFAKNTRENNKLNIKPLTISACAGLGGIGKTQLALEYIHHTKHPYTLKAWFAAENTVNLEKKYVEFAKSLGFAYEKLSAAEAIAYVKKWLSEHPGWLLVYDNVNCFDEISPFLPDSGGQVIITTRNQYWPTNFNVLSIDLMNKEESIKMIQLLTKRYDERVEVEELAETLGYLPLALAQSSAYIYQNKLSIAEYLELYKKHEQEILSEPILPEGTNNLPVAVTWNISLNIIAKNARLNNELPISIEILTVCSYLAPEKISRQVLLAWLKEAHPNLSSPELVLNKSLRALWQYSLIRYDDEEHISVHRLVQTILRHQHKQILAKNGSKERNAEVPPLTLAWYNTILRACHLDFSRKTILSQDELRQKELFPHLLHLVDHYERLWPKNESIAFGHILSHIGTILRNQLDDSNFKFGLSYFERALAIFILHYGEDHIEVARALSDVGNVLRNLGDSKRAQELYFRALTIKKKHYGEDHAEVALTIGNIGTTYTNLGQPLLAIEFHKEALKLKEKYYNKNHIEIAITLHNLAKAYVAMENFSEAEKLYVKAVNISESQYGENHIRLSAMLKELANIYTKLGNTKRAQVCLNRVESLTTKLKKKNWRNNFIIYEEN